LRPLERVPLHHVDPTNKQLNGRYRDSKYLGHEKREASAGAKSHRRLRRS